MAKATKKKRKLTTNEALEALLGAKASKRLRKLAAQIADEDGRGKKNDGRGKKKGKNDKAPKSKKR